MLKIQFETSSLELIRGGMVAREKMKNEELGEKKFKKKLKKKGGKLHEYKGKKYLYGRFVGRGIKYLKNASFCIINFKFRGVGLPTFPPPSPYCKLISRKLH